MNTPFETSFINRTIEKTPFADYPAQRFFTKWCEINDSIVPQFIERKEWKERGLQGILEKNDQGKQTLFLPDDLHLWEMIDIIRTVDHDTLARKPEKKDERADKIQELGVTFQKAGLYLSEYLPTIKEEDRRQIASDIASDFYQYGLSLQAKEKGGHLRSELRRTEEEIPESSTLSEEDKSKLDEWFLGKEVYQKRMARLGENPTEEQREGLRKKLLSVYFKGLTREGHKAEGEKPWETKVGPMQHLQDRTTRQITKAVETPEREMKTTIFRRGVEKLITEMKVVGWREAMQTFLKEGAGLDLATEKVKLYNSLHIDQLKQELEKVRETGNTENISVKELEIAKKIQRAVSSFAYKGEASNPSEMIQTQYINCVGSSILGGALLDEVGIKYLHTDLPNHSATILITSDGKVYWQDFTPGATEYNYGNYKEITREDIEENDPIKQLAEPIADSGVSLTFKKWNPYPHVRGKLRVTLSNPETGLQSQLIYNIGVLLDRLGKYQEAIEAYKQAININPKYADLYLGLGYTLSSLGKHEEAVEAYKQAININPKYANLYYNIGHEWKALGKHKEAIEAYEMFIKLWDGDQSLVDRARNVIKELKEIIKIK